MIARWAIVGMVLWLVVALAFRVFGGSVFVDGSGVVPSLFLTVPLVIGAVTYLLIRVLRVAHSDRAEAASVFAAAGLIVGVFEVTSYQQAFPDLPLALRDEFAALIFACVAAVVFVGLVSSRVESI